MKVQAIVISNFSVSFKFVCFSGKISIFFVPMAGEKRF